MAKRLFHILVVLSALSLYPRTAQAADSIIVSEIMYHPASDNSAEEFIELLNVSSNTVALGGWKLTRGVSFTFPDVTLSPGQYLVVAANLATFSAKYPSVSNAVGDWQGVLANSGETIELSNAANQRVDRIRYADEGDWAVRRRGRLQFNSRGWEWEANHDGLGCSAELVNPALSRDNGQNWQPSIPPNGTPGTPNSTATTNLPPMILDTTHFPVSPSSTNPVRITSRIIDESSTGLSISVHYRNHSTLSPPAFTRLNMRDDGLLGDFNASDGIFTSIIPPHPHGTIIEFYIRAVDNTGANRTWPAVGLNENDLPVQIVNALYQVNDTPYTGSQPVVRIIMTETERAEFESIHRGSDAEMNATLVSSDGVNDEIRYNNGLRLRGASSRNAPVPNYRINIPTDRRWQGLQALNLNAYYVHSQLIGSVLSLKAGLAASDARAVQVRVNGQNLAGSDPPVPSAGDGFGTYALVEPLNSDWAENHFPNDANGNAYSARRPNLTFTPDLSHRGTDPQSYRSAGYAKESNDDDDDWSDLIHLTDTLENSSDANYADAFRQVADPLNWVRYFALNTLLGNSETSLSTGVADDYNMFAGQHDTRFRLLPHDWDSILVESSLPVTSDIFRATQLPAVNRFLKHPEFAPLYFQELLRLMDTVCSTNTINATLDQFLTSFVDPATIDSMKTYAAARADNVRNQIPLQLTATNSLPITWNFPYASSSQTTVHGTANASTTRSIRVNGQPADYSAWQGTWTNVVTLKPGINRLFVEALNESGTPIESTHVDVYYDNASDVQITGGTLTTNAVWSPIGNAYHINSTLVVPPDTILYIAAGTTVFFARDVSLVINGTLIADGTANNPIRFIRKPQNQWAWNGIHINNSTNDNMIRHSVFQNIAPASPITVRNSSATLDGVRFEVQHTCLDFINSSLVVQNCHFPKLRLRETVIGEAILPGGQLVFKGNYFGGTTGYNDIIDFTGGARPGPIVQVISNLFEFASDDAVDFDGTDAHIEGNIFRHIHRDADRESIASAIATDAETHLVVTRNIFYDCDNGINLKRGSYAVVANNVFVGSTDAAITFGSTNRTVLPAVGAYIDGNIFWNNANHFTQYNEPGYSMAALDVRNSILQGTNWPGPGNLTSNPMFVDPNGDFRLLPGSPAIGAGPNGLDIGAHVPAGVSINGEPTSPTLSRNATLTFDGPGYNNPLIRDWADFYRYRINNDPWSSALPISQPLQLSNLPDGTYTVQAIGRNSAGIWQTQSQASSSKTWIVDSSLQGLVLSEVFAHNSSAFNHSGTTPDAIELHNRSANPIDLSGMQLTDDPATPGQFVFPVQTFIPANSYLVLLADNPNGTPGIHLGFSLRKHGEAVYLFDSVARGGTLLDSVQFGLQIENYSIARRPDDSWGLAYPTLGAPNHPTPTAGPNSLRISEWLAVGSGDDFVEIHNSLPVPVDLSGCRWSDKPVGWPDRHIIQPLSFIGPNSYLEFKADSNADRGPNHLNFNLSYEQGTIALLNPNNQIIDHVVYGPQQFNVSIGFLTPSSSIITPLPELSPGQSNLNTPPSITITTPANNAIINGDIIITASASDPDGRIVRVEFYADAIRIGQALSPPYTLTWQPSPRTYSLFARAIDDRISFTDSASVTVTSVTEVILQVEPVIVDNQVIAARVTFDASSNTAYVIESTTELFNPSWTTAFTLTAQPFNYTPTLEFPVNPGTHYFRLRTLP